MRLQNDFCLFLDVTAVDFHLLRDLIVESLMPIAAAVVAAPMRNLWPE